MLSCKTYFAYANARTQGRVKNLLPLDNAPGHFSNQTNALQHISDVVDSPFLSNSQDPDSLEEQKKQLSTSTAALIKLLFQRSLNAQLLPTTVSAKWIKYNAIGGFCWNVTLNKNLRALVPKRAKSVIIFLHLVSHLVTVDRNTLVSIVTHVWQSKRSYFPAAKIVN